METTLPSINRLAIEQIALEFWKSLKYGLQISEERKLLRHETTSTRSEKRLAIVPVPKRFRCAAYDSIQLKWARVWNELPEALRVEEDEPSFKRAVKLVARSFPLV